MSEQQPPPRPRPTPTPRMVLCPFCGSLTASMERCGRCGGRYDPLSRQASQNAMGPWFIRDESRAFMPGCSYETVRQLASRGRIRPTTVMRGPTTNQFWTLAKRTPGVAHLLGVCHNCEAAVDPDAYGCGRCGAVFHVDADRQHLGLAPMQMLPGEAPPAVIAAMSGPPLASEPLEVTRSDGPGVSAAGVSAAAASVGRGPRAHPAAAQEGVGPREGPEPEGGGAARRRWALAGVLILAAVVGAGAMGGVLLLTGALEAGALRAPGRAQEPPGATGERSEDDATGADVGEPSSASDSGAGAGAPEEGTNGGAGARDGGESEVFELLREDSEAALGTVLVRLRTTGVPGSGPPSEPDALEEVVRLRLAQRRLRRMP